jgi:arylsulfatase A-like enzyme
VTIPTLRQTVILSISLAVLAGAVEACARAFQQFALNRIVFASYDHVWLTPLAFPILVVPVAIGTHLLMRVIRLPLTFRTASFALTAVLSFSLLLPYTKVFWLASAIFAVGLASQIARWVAHEPERALYLLRRLAASVAVLAALAGVGVRGARASEWSNSAATPPMGGPNILIIVLDTVRAANLGLHGYSRATTPELNQLAERSIVFDRAIATAPWTLPSHGSLFTGRQPKDLRGGWVTPIRSGARSLAEIFRDRGYATGGFVGNLLYTSYESGLSRGFTHYDDYRLSWQLLTLHSSLSRIDFKSDLPLARSAGAAWKALRGSRIHPGGPEPADVFRPADQITRAFLDWQEANAGRPFFGFLNFFDAHGPYRSPVEFLQRFARGPDPTLDRYDAAIAWLDHVVGEIADTLRARGVLDNTILVVTSDHGELFGEHDLTGHANSLYMPLLHVPLLIRFPPKAPPTRVPAVVSLVDLPATVLDLAGVGDSNVPGDSLTAYWREPSFTSHDVAFAELQKGRNVEPTNRNVNGDMSAAIDARFHLILNADGTEELFDYRADPGETKSLTAEPSMQPVLVRLRAELGQR